ncbi:MAG: hypothetical protein ABW007_00865 [Chitinophagaceae bacterium]
MLKPPVLLATTISCFISILLATSCTKPVQEDPGKFIAVTYPKGEINGLPVENSVGSAGGTITSADGKLKVSVPAGAVTNTTLVSIQEITNTLPLGAGPSYRVLPAGLTLSKPITITLSYDETDLDGSDENALDLATQDDNGTWKRIKNTQLNKAAKTLVVESDHLGDYSFTGGYKLSPDKAALGQGESTVLTVSVLKEKNTEADEKEAELGNFFIITNAGDIETWSARGEGQIVARGSTAEFKAPSPISGHVTTEVSASVRNVKRPGRLTSDKLVLRKKITMSSDSFMAGYYDGVPFTCVGVSAFVASGVTVIQGATANNKSVLIFVNGTDVGSYSYGNPSEAGKAEIRCDLTGVIHETVYTLCGPPSSTGYASGGMTINNYQQGGVIAGNFTATLYDDIGCQLKTKKITAAFRVKK